MRKMSHFLENGGKVWSNGAIRGKNAQHSYGFFLLTYTGCLGATVFEIAADYMQIPLLLK